MIIVDYIIIPKLKFSGIERDYEFRRKYALDNEKIILFMGRLVYEKGIQHLISAMPKIINHVHVLHQICLHLQ